LIQHSVLGAGRCVVAAIGSASIVVGCALDQGESTALASDAQYVDQANGLHVGLKRTAAEDAGDMPRAYPALVYAGRLWRPYRLTVSLTDSESGVPLANVFVAAKVIATTWIGPLRPLEMVPAREGTFMGQIELPERGPYRIDLEMEWPGGRSYVQFGFDY
jgi:hypothetical protein